MLFLLFHLGPDRYALQASHVIEVVPLVTLKSLPHAPAGVAGMFNYRGQLVPAVDLSQLTLGVPAAQCLSTRIIVVNYTGAGGTDRLLGLIAEKATETLRTDVRNFVAHGLKLRSAPYLGPVMLDPQGPIQWLDEKQLVSGPISRFLSANAESFDSSAAVQA